MSGDASDNDDAALSTTLMRQKLMFAEQVYLYKIPSLKTAGGHRCEQKQQNVDVCFVCGM